MQRYTLTSALLASFESGTTARRIANRALVKRIQDTRSEIPVAMEPYMEEYSKR